MRWIIVVLAVASIACMSAQAPEPEPTPTPTATATSTSTPTPRATWAVDPRVERNKSIWAAATPRPIPTPRYDEVYPQPPFKPHWEYGPDRAWMVTAIDDRFVLDCATGEAELYIEIAGDDPLPDDGLDSVDVVWAVPGGPFDGTPDTWARSADGRTLYASGVFELHVLAGAPWAVIELPGTDGLRVLAGAQRAVIDLDGTDGLRVFWFEGPDATIDTSRLSCVP